VSIDTVAQFSFIGREHFDIIIPLVYAGTFHIKMAFFEQEYLLSPLLGILQNVVCLCL